MDEIEISDSAPERLRGFILPQKSWIAINGEGLGEIFRSQDVAIPLEMALLPSRHLMGEPSEHLALGGRAAVLVCSECGDIGCGALFVGIEIGGDSVIWSDFLYANNYEPEADVPRSGRYEFDRDQYERALGG